mmetsp:Transcript_30549/g.64658  ORF Transcript_30549/g.64658 Transcript_30549/m.64658 type:complete len:87 (-) Transcript_30549:183-443(-)
MQSRIHIKKRHNLHTELAFSSFAIFHTRLKVDARTWNDDVTRLKVDARTWNDDVGDDCWNNGAHIPILGAPVLNSHPSTPNPSDAH